MTKILTIVKIAALVVLIAVLLEARSLLVDVRRDAGLITADIHTLQAPIQATLHHADEASKQAALAAVEQRAYWNKTSLETYKTMASLRLTITRTDRSINDVLVPRLSGTLESTTALTKEAADSLRSTTAAVAPAIADLAVAARSAANILSDPSIRDTLVHLDETSTSLAAGTKSLSKVASDAQDAADFELAQLKKPARWWMTVLKVVLGLGSEARILFVGAK
jgi:hypothetical protein